MVQAAGAPAILHWCSAKVEPGKKCAADWREFATPIFDAVKAFGEQHAPVVAEMLRQAEPLANAWEEQ
jgi:hypothetical protein